MPNTEIAGNDIHDRRIAAMTVEEQYLTDTRAGDPVTDFVPVPHQHICRHGQCPRETDMLLALADCLRRQDQNRCVFRQQCQRSIEDPFIDADVNGKRQMRPVLFDCGYRQNRDRPGGIQPGEIRRTHLRPVTPNWRHCLHPLHCCNIHGVATKLSLARTR